MPKSTFNIIRSPWLVFLLAFYLMMPGKVSAQRYTNLALEGGGIRGIAYAGAFVELEKHHVLDSIRQVSGTSVGAIAGCLLSVGYKASEIRELMFGLRLQHFNDGKWIFLGGQQRMRRQFGWYRGDALERWISKQIEAKTGNAHLTFGQLHTLARKGNAFKDLYVTASNLSRQELCVFSWQHFPDMEVATAVRTSISIPLYFRAMQLDSTGRKSKTGDIYVDGGLLMNYPLTVFDSGCYNPATLGLKLERPEQIPYYRQSTAIAPYPIRDFRNYVGALYNLTIETLNRKSSMEDEQKRTIYISTAGIYPKLKRMSRAKKMILYDSGRQAAQDFFQ